MKLTLQQLEAHLWGAANILRGKTAGQDYKNYILSLMFYKRLCDQWENEADDAIAELERGQGRPFTEKQKAVFRKRGEHRFNIPDGSRWGDVKAASTNIGNTYQGDAGGSRRQRRIARCVHRRLEPAGAGRVWKAVAPDPCLYPHRYTYNWLCSIYVAHRRRQRGTKDNLRRALPGNTGADFLENTSFIAIAEALPVFKIDKDYATNLDELPTPADKAAALELSYSPASWQKTTRVSWTQLGERLQRIKERRDAGDDATARRLRELEEIAAAAVETKTEPERLNLIQPGEDRVFYYPPRTRAVRRRRLSCRLRAPHGWSPANEQIACVRLE